MHKEKRTLIEKYLPVEEISEEAKQEKKPAYHPPISDMKFYWTRKPLITARAAILGSILPEDYDLETFKKDLGLGKKKRAHYYDFDETTIEKIKEYYLKQYNSNDFVVFDPFAGGGSIPFETIRMGLSSYANDYNPLSWLILNGSILYPIKFNNLNTKIENLYNHILKRIEKELGNLYPNHSDKKVATYIFSWYVQCPKCNLETPLVASWKLFKDRSGKNTIYLKPIVASDNITYTIEKNGIEPEPTIRSKKGICLHCGSTIENIDLMKDIREKQNYKMIAVVSEGKKKKEFDVPSSSDLEALEKAKEKLSKEWNNLLKENLVPIEEIPPNPSGIHNYFVYWNRVFNPRQLLFLSYMVRIIREETKNLKNNGKSSESELIGLYLSMLLGKHIGTNSRLSTYNATGQNVASATSNKLNSIQWDHTEINPFSNSSGSINNIKKYIIKGIEYSNKNLFNKKGSIQITNFSILHYTPDTKFKLIVTDPPYKDDVPYGEFSDFFYVWESRALEGIYSKINPVLNNYETPKDEEIDESLLRSEKFFERAFKKAIKKLYEILDDDGLLTLFFAHSSISAWDLVINALQLSGFWITATWPVHTEYSANVLARGKASIMSSIIIVARKRKKEKSGYIEEIQEELQKHLKKRLEEFWGYGLRGADLTVAAMGATLDIITQYSEIKSYTGDMKVRDVLELVQKFVAEYVLERYLENASGLDPQTSFYLYLRLSEIDGMPFDTANLISKSLNIDLKGFEKQGLIESVSKAKAKGIKLLKFNERDHIGMDSLIDAVHCTMKSFEKGGYAEVERVMNDIPYGRTEIKDVLIAFQSLSPDDSERQISQRILERMGNVFPKDGQMALDNYKII
mgnify:CR=1 FL=1